MTEQTYLVLAGFQRHHQQPRNWSLKSSVKQERPQKSKLRQDSVDLQNWELQKHLPKPLTFPIQQPLLFHHLSNKDGHLRRNPHVGRHRSWRVRWKICRHIA